jgi:hypothetical protein
MLTTVDTSVFTSWWKLLWNQLTVNADGNCALESRHSGRIGDVAHETPLP